MRLGRAGTEEEEETRRQLEEDGRATQKRDDEKEGGDRVEEGGFTGTVEKIFFRLFFVTMARKDTWSDFN